MKWNDLFWAAGLLVVLVLVMLAAKWAFDPRNSSVRML